jgi:chromosome segregation ATPase
MACTLQLRKSAGQQTRLASANAELDEKAEQISALQAAQKRSDQQHRQLKAEAEDLAAQLQALQQGQAQAVGATSPTNSQSQTVSSR